MKSFASVFWCHFDYKIVVYYHIVSESGISLIYVTSHHCTIKNKVKLDMLEKIE